MKITGCVNGNNPDDKRCTDHVDFSNTGRTLWEGEDFDCTYCGQEWRKGTAAPTGIAPVVPLWESPVAVVPVALLRLPKSNAGLPGVGWGR